MTEIRRIQPQDRDRLSSILKATDMFTPAEIDVALELIDADLADADQEDYHVYVADLMGQPVGYACFGPTPATEGTYDLYWIAVDPSVQNQGIGKALLGFVERTVAERKGRLVVIETSSQPKYEPTRQFYLRFGYELEARVRGFYKPGDDRLIFVKTLIPEKGGS
jgi:GNAT superfamily N-acetyltransferase